MQYVQSVGLLLTVSMKIVVLFAMGYVIETNELTDA